MMRRLIKHPGLLQYGGRGLPLPPYCNKPVKHYDPSI